MEVLSRRMGRQKNRGNVDAGTQTVKDSCAMTRPGIVAGLREFDYSLRSFRQTR
jgi:hypothetical protein